MKHSKQTFILAFGLFSLFFGAGNLILPPYLGYQAGKEWFWVTLGFALSAVVIPIMAIYGHAKLQGTLLDFARKVSPKFALVFGIIVYFVSVSLPAPRTASVTYEMGIAPYFELSSLGFSTLYFGLVAFFVLFRTKILGFIGKFLTPLILVLLILIVVLGLFLGNPEPLDSKFGQNFTAGILEGYQTFDAIGGVVVGAVLVISLELLGKYTYTERKQIIFRAGLLSGFCLLAVYAGLIALGATFSGVWPGLDRAPLLHQLSHEILGKLGGAFLAVLIGLACFTTAVGIIVGTADFVKGLFKDSKKAYYIAALLCCFMGVMMGQNQVGFIIDIAFPALLLVYPVTIVLIVLNALPEIWAPKLVFRGVVWTTVLFSIPDFWDAVFGTNYLEPLFSWLPLAQHNLGWFFPVFLVFGCCNFSEKKALFKHISGRKLTFF